MSTTICHCSTARNRIKQSPSGAPRGSAERRGQRPPELLPESSGLGRPVGSPCGRDRRSRGRRGRGRRLGDDIDVLVVLNVVVQAFLLLLATGLGEGRELGPITAVEVLEALGVSL